MSDPCVNKSCPTSKTQETAVSLKLTDATTRRPLNPVIKWQSYLRVHLVAVLGLSVISYMLFWALLNQRWHESWDLHLKLSYIGEYRQVLTYSVSINWAFNDFLPLGKERSRQPWWRAWQLTGLLSFICSYFRYFYHLHQGVKLSCHLCWKVSVSPDYRCNSLCLPVIQVKQRLPQQDLI